MCLLRRFKKDVKMIIDAIHQAFIEANRTF